MRSSVDARILRAKKASKAARSSKTRSTPKFFVVLLAASLVCGLLPARALAASPHQPLIPEGGSGAVRIASSAEGASEGFSHCLSDGASSADADSAAVSSENASDTMEGGADAARPMESIINQQFPLEPIARKESVRTFFLARSLESAKTVPMVSAELPFDEEPVVGSFEHEGMTFAIEPGGESASLVAVDYAKLPRQLVEKQVLVIPSAVAPDGRDSYSVTRIAEGALASLTKESADPAYAGAEGLASGEGAPASVKNAPFEANGSSGFEDEVGNNEEGTGTVADPFEGRIGILVLSIPASVASIEEGAFSGSDTLQYLMVSEGNAEYATYDGALYDKGLSELLFVPEGRVGSVHIASSATVVDPEVFAHCLLVDGIVADATSRAFRSEDGCLYGKDSDELVYDPANRESASAMLMVRSGDSADALFGRTLAKTVTVYGNGGTLTKRVINQNEDVISVDKGLESLSRGLDGAARYYGKNGSNIIDWWYSGIKWSVTADPRPGYRLSGFSKSADGALLEPDDPTAFQEPAVFYAIWQKMVVVTGNGGPLKGYVEDASGNHIVKLDGLTYWEGDLLGARAYYAADERSQIHWFNQSVFTCVSAGPRAGYSLIGFSKTPDGALLADHDPVSFDDPAYFYARWSRNEYSVSYNDSGGSFSGKTGSYNIESSDFKLPASGTRTGYIFAGWDVTGAQGAGVTGNGTANVTVKRGTYGNLTATAKWAPVSYSISWDPSGGSLSGQKTSYDIETADYVLPAPARTGYTFAGWDVTGAQGAGVAGNGTVSATIKKGTYGDLAVQAKWTINTYRLSWSVPHGTHGNRTEDFTVEDCPISMGEAVADDGYTFTGWSGEGLAGDPSSFALDSSFLAGKEDGAALSFAAGFSPNPYTVRLHVNDGTDDVVEHAVTYDATVDAVAVPKRYGYAFSGYHTKENDGSKGELYFGNDGTYARDAGAWKGLSDVDLYACWTLIGNLEVPVTAPSAASFSVDRATGQASATDGSSALPGLIRSSMPEEVPVASLALEGLKGGDGVSLAEKLLGEGNSEKCAMEVVFSPEGPSPRAALLKLASSAGSVKDETIWEFSATERPLIPSAVAVADGTTGEGIVADPLGNLARVGELSLSYALKTLSGFDVYKVPLIDATEAVARIVFTVDLTGVEQELF